MANAFSYIGAAFICLSLLVVIGEMWEAARRERPLGNDDYLRAMGMAGFWVWVLLVLGIAGWLISLPLGWLVS